MNRKEEWIASCSSEEKVPGKAKEKRLTVYVGEYCSKKAQGICIEKKRGYCQFDSKLARIVQGAHGNLVSGLVRTACRNAGVLRLKNCRKLTFPGLTSPPSMTA